MIILSIADVERITAIPDPVIRNLNITQCYYELSNAMEKLLGINPNWCTFAVWASKQAGQSIRREDITRTYEYYFRHSPEIKSILENISLVGLLKNLPEVKTITDSIVQVINVDTIFETSAMAVEPGTGKFLKRLGKSLHAFLLSSEVKMILHQKRLTNTAQYYNPANRLMVSDCFAMHSPPATRQNSFQILKPKPRLFIMQIC